MGVRIGHRGDRWIELSAWHATTGAALRFSDITGALLFLRERIGPDDVRTLRALLTHDNATTGRLDDAAVMRLVAHRLCARTLKAVVWHERRDSFVERRAAWQPARVELPAAEPRIAQPQGEFEIAPTALPDDLDPAAQASTLREAARSGVPFCEICQRSSVARHSPASAKTKTSGQARPTSPVTTSPATTSPVTTSPVTTSPRPSSPAPTSPRPSSPAPTSPATPDIHEQVETLPADSDAAVQAAALRGAARKGAPFCEICRKQAAAKSQGTR